MLFANYSDFRMTLVDTIKRNDLDVELKRFVLMAEEHFNHVLRHSDMQKFDVEIALTGGVGALPADYLDFSEIRNDAGDALTLHPGRTARPSDRHAYVEVPNVVVGQVTGSVYADYFARIPTITGSASATNWLLTRYPRAYLYGAAYEAMDFVGDMDAAKKFMGQRDSVVRQVNIEGERKRFANARVMMEGLI